MNNKILKKIPSLIYSFARLLFLLGIIYVIIFPILYALSSSLLTDQQLIDPSVVWVPKSITFDNFRVAFEALEYGKTFTLSMFLCVVSTLLQIVSCSLAAYGLARFKFKGRNIFFFCVVLTIIFPPQMLVVQQYAIFKGMGVLNTVFTFFLPAAFGQGVRAGLMIYIFRQFVKGLPKELEEAAYIDGCGVFKTFWRIVVPSMAVSFLVVAIFSMVWYWNESLTATMFFDDMKPLSVRITELKSVIAQDSLGINAVRNVIMSGVILFITPMLVLYAFLQKYFIQGIERSGLVG